MSGDQRSPLAARVLDLLEHETVELFPMPPRFSVTTLCRTLNVDDSTEMRAAVDELYAEGLIEDYDVAFVPSRHVAALLGVEDLEAAIANSRYNHQLSAAQILEVAGQAVAWVPDVAVAVHATRAVTLLLIKLTRADLHDADLTAQVAAWDEARCLPEVARLLGSMIAQGQVRPPRSVAEVAALIHGILDAPQAQPR